MSNCPVQIVWTRCSLTSMFLRRGCYGAAILLPTAIPAEDLVLILIQVNSFGFGGSNAFVIMDDAFHFLQGQATRNILSSMGGHFNQNGHSSKEIRRNGCSVPSELDHHKDQSRWKQQSLNGDSTTADQDLNLQPRCPTRSKLLIFSAANEISLKTMAGKYSEFFEKQNPEIPRAGLENIAYTLSSRRSLHIWRSYAVISPTDGSLKQIISKPSKHSNIIRSLAFIFTGQGAQYARMGAELLYLPVFKHCIERLEDFLMSLESQWSLKGTIRTQSFPASI